MSASINDSHSLPPAHATGKAGAAGYVRTGTTVSKPTFTVNGLTAEESVRLAVKEGDERQARAAGNAALAEGANLHEKQKLAANLLAQRISALKANEGLNEVGFRNGVNEFVAKSPDIQEALQAPDAARAWHQEARNHVAELRAELSTPGGSLADDRAVQRSETRLAASESSLQTARELISEAETRDELAATLDAVDAHFRAKGESVAWLDGDIAARVPEFAEAVAAERQAEELATYTQANGGVLSRAIDAGQPISVPLTPPPSAQ